MSSIHAVRPPGKAAPIDVRNQAAGWARHAEPLADWALSRVVVRRDVHGRYSEDGKQFTSRDPLDRDLLVRHFRGEVIIGVHSTGTEGLCLAITWDIDAHDDKADPEANWRCALRATELLSNLGLDALIFDSNGRGGFHVRVFLKRPIPTEAAYWLCERIKAALAAEDLKCGEAFPKQPGVSLDRPYGNWIRLPGKHHKRDHWSRIFDPKASRWLAGEAAARRLLKVAGDDPDELLKAHRAELAATAPAKPATNGRGRSYQAGGRKADEATVREALEHLPAGWADDYGGERGNTAWLGVGMALHDWDQVAGLPLWKEFSQQSAKYDPAVCEEKWRSFSAGCGLSVGTIFAKAREYGWKAPVRPQAKTKPTPSANGNGNGNGNGSDRHSVTQRAGGEDPAPAIEITTKRHEVLEQTIRALARDRDIYTRGSSLVIVATTNEDSEALTGKTVLKQTPGGPTIIHLSEAVLGCYLTRNADFYQFRIANGEPQAVDVHPPDWLIRATATRKLWPGLRELAGVVEAPFLRPDGSVVETPGYDPVTRTFYRPSIEFPGIPDRPTQADAIAAWGRLKALVRQFPFESEADRTVWGAALLSTIGRPAIDGPVPGFAFNGNKAGTGKGLAVDTIGNAAFGRNIPTSIYPVDPVEAAKVALAFARAGKPAIHFDNLEEGSPYGSSALDSSLTSTTVDGRILGTSESTGEIASRATWFLSGNNIFPAKDAYRRWLPCNLVTDLERPEERGDIEIRDLRTHVLEHRGEIVLSALTILRAHAVAGYPTGDWAPLGSFEEWDRVIRGALWFAGAGDCCVTRRKAADDSPERLARVALLEGWKELPGGRSSGVTANRACELVDRDRDSYPTLYNALVLFGRDGKPATPRQVGNKLRGMKGNVIAGMKFETAGEEHKIVRWVVVETGPSSPGSRGEGGSGGSGGSDSGYPAGDSPSGNYASTCGGREEPYGDRSAGHPPDPPDPPESGDDPPIEAFGEPPAF
jgi:Primase C terminal 2 (PriCT-2)